MIVIDKLPIDVSKIYYLLKAIKRYFCSTWDLAEFIAKFYLFFDKSGLSLQNQLV